MFLSRKSSLQFDTFSSENTVFWVKCSNGMMFMEIHLTALNWRKLRLWKDSNHNNFTDSTNCDHLEKLRMILAKVSFIETNISTVNRKTLTFGFIENLHYNTLAFLVNVYCMASKYLLNLISNHIFSIEWSARVSLYQPDLRYAFAN